MDDGLINEELLQPWSPPTDEPIHAYVDLWANSSIPNYDDNAGRMSIPVPSSSKGESNKGKQKKEPKKNRAKIPKWMLNPHDYEGEEKESILKARRCRKLREEIKKKEKAKDDLIAKLHRENSELTLRLEEVSRENRILKGLHQEEQLQPQ